MSERSDVNPTLRLALPKGRNLGPTLEVLAAAGVVVGLDPTDRRLLVPVSSPALAPAPGQVEVLLLKDWDVPLYVEHGIADVGVVGSDVLGEQGGDLLVPLTWRTGLARLSLIGPPDGLPRPGTQVRLATKYPHIARQLVGEQPWGAEILELSGSIELAPLLGLAEVALDVVQTGRTLAENGLVELLTVMPVAPCLVVNRAAWQRDRVRLVTLVRRVEQAIDQASAAAGRILEAVAP